MAQVDTRNETRSRSCFESVPSIGLGTFRMTDFDECETAIREALKIGYRHIDGAEAYQNEEALGAAVRNSGVPREEVFLTTKVLHPSYTDRYDAEGIIRAARTSLKRLGCDSVDLFYGVHWPGGERPLYDVDALMKASEQLYSEGLFEYFGVSNLTPELIEEIRVAGDLPLDAVQVEMHPMLPQRQLRSYARSRNIDVVGYAPLANGRALALPEIQDVARKHQVSEAAVCIAWALEKDVIPVPKSCSPEHLRQNWAARELSLDDADIRRIDGVTRRERVYDPQYAPDWDPVRL